MPTGRPDTTILLNHGPISMTLSARRETIPSREAAECGAVQVVEMFDALVASNCFAEARNFIEYVDTTRREEFPETLTRMFDSTAALREPFFTPMAAVAGTFSDLAVEAMAAAGADYAVANNGGDIAYRLPAGRSAFKVGVISDLKHNKVTHILTLAPDLRKGGIATSGFGGRSLTRGVASAVTVLARSSSEADAAATSIANATDCDDPAIVRCLACELDTTTDIPGLSVTKEIGPLCTASIRGALEKGAKRAEELCERGMIRGAVLFLAGAVATRWAGDRAPFHIESRG